MCSVTHYAFDTHSYYCLVLDYYCKYGEIFPYMRSIGALAPNVAHEKIRMYAAELYLALHALHSEDIIYRDLKTENILMDAKGHFLLADLGLCKQTKTTGSFCGTAEYMAPELLEGKNTTKMNDWWAFGTLVYELICGIPPFYAQNINGDLDEPQMCNNILHNELKWNGKPEKWESQTTAKNFLKRLLNKNPKKRLGYDNEEDIKNDASKASIGIR